MWHIIQVVSLEIPKSKISLESYNHFLLAYKNSMKPMILEGGHIKIPQEEFLDVEGPKFQSYIKWNYLFFYFYAL